MGEGKHEDILSSIHAFAKVGIKLPVLVYPDGTALLVLKRELDVLMPPEQVSLPLLVDTRKREAEEIIPKRDSGLYRTFGMPAQVRTFPFSKLDMRHGSPKSLCYGLVIYRDEFSPREDSGLKTVEEIHEALQIR